MFRSFRNKVLAIYIVSILIILIGSLSFVYIRSESEMEASINQRLDGMPKDPNSNIDAPIQGDSLPSELDGNEHFDVGEARDLTIYQNENAEQKISDYMGDQYVINYQEQTITANGDTYVYRKVDGVYKVVKITYDLQYLENLKTTLFIFGVIASLVFSIMGFVLITNLIRPLKRSYEIQNRFVSDASHELKTPLAIIKSCLQLIANNDDDKENLIEYCQGETERLIRLTSNLLQLSENDKGEYEQIDISNTLDILISGVEVNLFEKNIKLETEITPDVWARVASDDINQLAHILIDNAVKYNDSRKRIKINLKLQNKYLVLTVINSSEQVTSEDIEHLFDRFYRVDDSRALKGFGLGLSLAKHITEKYNGDIKAEYSSGYFTVNVKIPLS